LIITDTKLSSLNQSNALAIELAKKSKGVTGILHKTINKSFLHILPNQFIYFFLVIKFFFKKETFEKKIKLIISCGRISAPYNLILKKKLKCPNFHILDPYFNHNSFQKIIVPEHDLNKFKSTSNILITKGTLVDQSRLKINKFHLEKLDKKFNKKKKILLLIGGDGRSSKVTENDIEGTVLEMNKLYKKFQIICCFSRRTSEKLKKFIREKSNANYIFFPNKDFNPYWTLLKISDYLFVTEDSVSMTSDALSTGKPTYMIPVKKNKKKILTFQKKIRGEGLTKHYKKKLEVWSYQKLSESKRICIQLQDFLVS